MNNESPSKCEIMLRVKTVRGVRALAASPLASGLLGIVLLSSLSIVVSIGDIFANTMAHVDWSERFAYAFSSLLHSRVIVQTIASLAVVASFLAFINSMRKIPVRKIFFMFGSTQQV